MVDLHAVIAKALPLCEPLKGENKELEEVAQLAMKLVKERTAGLHEVVGVFFGGSFAKGTWLRGDADIDIFVKIKPSVNERRFEELGKEIGLSALKAHRPQLRYSDHPYVEAFIRKVRVNIVPCYEVEQGKWQSAADRSPFHTEYVSTNFDSEKRNQARLLKRFFKSCGLYG
ncbi:MAG: nucleotidyltransferase domain-containing protein, partial [Nitrososphaera sp.]